MNIKKFKKGDIITRNEPITYKHNKSQDSSYCGDRLAFIGFDETSKIIFLDDIRGLGEFTISFARDAWDEGWCIYPTKFEKENKPLKPLK